MMTPKQAVGRHIKAAKKIKDVEVGLRTLTDMVGELDSGHRKLGKKLLIRIQENLSESKSELDALYHGVATDADFKEHGHVYYGGKKAAKDKGA